MGAEEISAHDWGVGRLTVAQITHKIHKPLRSISQKSCSGMKWKHVNSQSKSSNRQGVHKRGFIHCSESNRCCTASRSNRKTLFHHKSKYFKKLSESFSPVSRSYTILLFFATLCSFCSAGSSGSKGPLISTDATKSTGFRHFMQDIDDVPMGRSQVGEYKVPKDDLSFQTLKVIKKWGNDTRDILLVGGKNHVYMLDSTLTHNQQKISYMERLTWVTNSQTRKQCQTYPGNPPELCENFIRMVELTENGELMVCGTNAFRPACRNYKRKHFNQPNDNEDSLYESESKCRGQCVVPYNPTTASAALYTNTANGYQIFTAVHNDFMSNDPRIMRKYNRTLLSSSHWLNDPTFLKILEYGDKVYVFFREIAEKYETKTDEEITYGRVAQMCKDDPGGTTVLANSWTSFLKARLKCGYSDRQHLQFNNLTSVSEITNITDENGDSKDVIFATFTTPWEWTDASLSAVCVFAMEDIVKLFDEGRFLVKYDIDANPVELTDRESDMSNLRASSSTEDESRKVTLAYPVPANKVPEPRPGSCLENPKPEVLFFAKEHPLMYDPIQPHFAAPIFVSYNNLRATQISVDTNAGDMGKLMIYLGTENGEVLRIRGMLTATKGPKAILIESVLVADEDKCEEDGCGVRALHVSRPPHDDANSKPSAFVAFTDYMIQFPLVRCSTYKTKECCSVDPDCGWDGEKCIQRTYENRNMLLPTSKDSDTIPESCNAIGQVAKGDRNIAVSQASTSSPVLFLVAFLGGCIFGALIVVLIVFIRRKRRRKHRVNKRYVQNNTDNEQEDAVPDSPREKLGSNYMEMAKKSDRRQPSPGASSPGGSGEKADFNAEEGSPPSSSQARSPETVPLVASSSEPTTSARRIPANDLATPQQQTISPNFSGQNSNNSNNRGMANIPRPVLNPSAFVKQTPTGDPAPLGPVSPSNIGNNRGVANTAYRLPPPYSPVLAGHPPTLQALSPSRFSGPNTTYSSNPWISSSAPRAANPRPSANRFPLANPVPYQLQLQAVRPMIVPFQCSSEGKPTNPVQPIRRNSSEEIPAPRVGSSIKKHQSFAGHDRIVKPPVPRKSLRAQSFAIRNLPMQTPRRALPQNVAPTQRTKT